MPAPAVYVLAVVGAVGAAIAFKEFVYEPVIAPRVERWAAEYLAKREAKRRQRAGPIGVPLRRHNRRRSDSLSSDTSESDDDDDKGGNSVKLGDSLEMNDLRASDVREWRSKVHRSTDAQMRLRKPARRPTTTAAAASSSQPLDESNQPLPYTPLSPSLVHVIVDPNDPSTPTTTISSTLPSRVSTPPPPAPQVSPLRSTATSVTQSSATSATSSSPVLLHRVRVSNPQSRSGNDNGVTSPSASSTTLERTSSPRTSLNLSSSVETIQQRNLLGDVVASVATTVAVSNPSPNNTPRSRTPLNANEGTEGLDNSYSAIQRDSSPTPVCGAFPHPVRSLSEIYPQELESERGVEFLSPPSSRSESPFLEVLPSPSGSPLPAPRTMSPRVPSSLSNYQSFSSPSSPEAVQDELSAMSSPHLANFSSLNRVESPWVHASPGASDASLSPRAPAILSSWNAPNDSPETPRSSSPRSPVSSSSPGSFYHTQHRASSSGSSSPYVLSSPRSNGSGDQYEYPNSPGTSPRLNPFTTPSASARQRRESTNSDTVNLQPPVDYPRSPSPSEGSSLSDLDFLSDLEDVERRSEGGRSEGSDGSWAI